MFVTVEVYAHGCLTVTEAIKRSRTLNPPPSSSPLCLSVTRLFGSASFLLFFLQSRKRWLLFLPAHIWNAANKPLLTLSPVCRLVTVAMAQLYTRSPDAGGTSLSPPSLLPSFPPSPSSRLDTLFSAALPARLDSRSRAGLLWGSRRWVKPFPRRRRRPRA